MRLREESASQCNGLFTEGGKVLTGRFHYRILFDHRTEKRNTEAKALFSSVPQLLQNYLLRDVVAFLLFWFPNESCFRIIIEFLPTETEILNP